METTAEIRVTSRIERDPFDPVGARIVQDYEWHGPVHGVALLSRALVRDWRTFDDLPWPVKVVGQEPWSLTIYVARCDGFLRLSYLRHRVAYGARRWFGMVKHRVLCTLAIWNLVDVRDTQVLQWSDIKWPWRRAPGK